MKILLCALALTACTSTREESADEKLADINAGSGHLPRNVIEKGLRAQWPAIEKCYRAALESEPSLKGSVKLQITIGPDGDVTKVTDAGSTLPDDDVLDCAKDAYEKAEFPAPKGGSVIVIYPLELGPQ